MRYPGVWAGVLFLFAAAAPARAGHPLITDDTGTLGRGGFQAQLGSTLARGDDGAEPVLAHALSLQYGILDAVDVGLNAGFESVLRGAGPGCVCAPALSVKWRVREQDGDVPALGVRADLPLPGGAGVSDLRHQGLLVALATWDLAPRFVSVNAAFMGPDAGDMGENEWFVSAAAGHRFRARWSGVVDVMHEGDVEFDEQHTEALVGFLLHETGDRVWSAGAGPVFEPGGRGLGWMATAAVTLSWGGE